MRFQVVQFYFANGMDKSLTALAFGTTRKTVRKIVERYRVEGQEGLKDRPRTPHSSPRRASSEIEKEVLELREKTNYGLRRLIRELRKRGIGLSRGGVWKILRRNGRSSPKKRLTIRKTGRRYYNPCKFEPFSFLQVDTKRDGGWGYATCRHLSPFS